MLWLQENSSPRPLCGQAFKLPHSWICWSVTSLKEGKGFLCKEDHKEIIPVKTIGEEIVGLADAMNNGV